MSSEKSNGTLKGTQKDWQEEGPKSEKAVNSLLQHWGIKQWVTIW